MPVMKCCVLKASGITVLATIANSAPAATVVMTAMSSGGASANSRNPATAAMMLATAMDPKMTKGRSAPEPCRPPAYPLLPLLLRPPILFLLYPACKYRCRHPPLHRPLHRGCPLFTRHGGGAHAHPPPHCLAHCPTAVAQHPRCSPARSTRSPPTSRLRAHSPGHLFAKPPC